MNVISAAAASSLVWGGELARKLRQDAFEQRRAVQAKGAVNARTRAYPGCRQGKLSAWRRLVACGYPCPSVE
jgi:hypothetical protein